MCRLTRILVRMLAFDEAQSSANRTKCKPESQPSLRGNSNNTGGPKSIFRGLGCWVTELATLDPLGCSTVHSSILRTHQRCVEFFWHFRCEHWQALSAHPTEAAEPAPSRSIFLWGSFHHRRFSCFQSNRMFSRNAGWRAIRPD